MRWRRRLAVLAAAVAVAVATPLAAAPPARATAVQGEETIGQFNMAGGQAFNANNGLAPANALIDSVNSRKPAFMTLQETCWNWMVHMGEVLQDDYELMVDWVREEAGGDYARCKNGHLFGNAILVRRDMGFSGLTLTDHQLGSDPEDEQREMLCITSEARNLTVCSTHLTPGDTASRRIEAQEAQQALNSSYPTRTRVLGGDLNDVPRSVTTSNFYAYGYGFGANGSFKEIMSPCGNTIGVWLEPLPPLVVPCRSGEYTFENGRKIDYLFAETDLTVTWSDVTDPLYSDHRLVWARVTGL